MKPILLSVAAGLTVTSTAFADPSRYYSNSSARENCNNVRDENGVAGAVLGGVAGGVLGNSVAGRGVREEGRILGALVGAIAGAGIAREANGCDDVDYIGYDDRRYSDDRYYDGAYRYEQRNDRYGYHTSSRSDDDLYGRSHDYRYPAQDDTIVQCQEVTRVTYLPDGREIHEPTQACREMHYGDWDVADD